jgi:hypothetical protein
LALTTVDEIVRRLNLDRVNVIKMDIKGATARALRGSAQTLQRFQPLVVVSTEEDADNPDSLVALVRNMAPRYRPVCGSCSLQAGVLHPDVVAFQP